MFVEAEKYNRRFCFILGSGASRAAGIKTGVEMAKQWATELEEKYERKELKNLMDKLHIDSIVPNSQNYFGIYDLRYYPDYHEGYAYFERELEKGSPSLGHYALAKILAGKKHNLAITTNFDSLVEDALFIYTNKHPLVVGHESLTQFINLEACIFDLLTEKKKQWILLTDGRKHCGMHSMFILLLLSVMLVVMKA